MQKLEERSSQEEIHSAVTMLFLLFVCAQINKKENHIFSSILNPHNRAV